jgi:23S rRNA (pseudouridine1915-N3)-methyltransferase
MGMKVMLIVVGKNKEVYIDQALDDYEKRINRYIPFRIEKLPGIKSSRKDSVNDVKEKESQYVLKALSDDGLVVLLDEKGDQTDTVQFARWLEKEFVSGSQSIIFVIGGAFGFAKELYKRSDRILSLSKMTLSHQIARIVFMEQLYRALTIIRGEPYHHGG